MDSTVSEGEHRAEIICLVSTAMASPNVATHLRPRDSMQVCIRGFFFPSLFQISESFSMSL